jgi:predicted DNA-binding transcriptional regulator YafY
MRASRLLSVLLLLQNRGRLTAEQIAQELEVSVRTVYRDIEALSAAGVPVYAERGRAGGFRLVGGFRTRLTGLTETEAQALALSGLPDAAAELGLGTTLAAAQLKLSAALPPELRARAEAVSRRFYVDVPGWFRDVESPPHLAAVADAVWNDQILRIRYEKWGRREVERTIKPLGLVLKAGQWYLVARSRNTTATYRVGRIHSVQVVGEFERADVAGDFDLAQFWATFSEQFEQRLYPRTARVRMSKLGRALAPYFLSAVGQQAVEAAHTEVDDEGWQEIELPVEAGRPALGELLRFGPEIEVLEPADLRAEVADAVHRMAATYE